MGGHEGPGTRMFLIAPAAQGQASCAGTARRTAGVMERVKGHLTEHIRTRRDTVTTVQELKPVPPIFIGRWTPKILFSLREAVSARTAAPSSRQGLAAHAYANASQSRIHGIDCPARHAIERACGRVFAHPAGTDVHPAARWHVSLGKTLAPGRNGRRAPWATGVKWASVVSPRFRRLQCQRRFAEVSRKNSARRTVLTSHATHQETAMPSRREEKVRQGSMSLRHGAGSSARSPGRCGLLRTDHAGALLRRATLWCDAAGLQRFCEWIARDDRHSCLIRARRAEPPGRSRPAGCRRSPRH